MTPQGCAVTPAQSSQHTVMTPLCACRPKGIRQWTVSSCAKPGGSSQMAISRIRRCWYPTRSPNSAPATASLPAQRDRARMPLTRRDAFGTGQPMSEERLERRLAAILATDVVGYSRLMGEDEEGTLAALKTLQRELIDLKVREHCGRLVKTTGDGALVEFASVVDAVRCAAEMQRAMVDRDVEIPVERRIRFRIGVNLGDVIAEDGDIFGDGVNIAARLEALAEPGGVCISRTVRDHIRDKLPYPFEDRGEQSVKNIARPVRIYALRPEAVADLPASGVLPKAPPQRHRAILAITATALAALVVAVAAWWLWPA